MQPSRRRDRPGTWRRVRRAGPALGPAIALALLVTGAAACGDGPSDASGTPGPPAPPNSEQLIAALVTTADFTDGTTVTPSERPEGEAAVTDDPACRPVMDLLGVQATGDTPIGTAGAMIAGPRGEAVAVVVLLASFPRGYASQLLGQGLAALPNCATFTGRTESGEKVAYTAERVAAPAYGEESLAVKLVTAAEGREVTAHYVIARVGDTLADFAVADTSGGPGRLPYAALVAKQIDKLKALK
ncbi:hypothetical protein [Yinghuangia sp. YIM S09857]|uniref:hypothetical protein n=1 Tax=Yinghuangia sp. YIM S09857 TaxID=3436929 RepID=UPI003F5343FD